MFIEALKTRP
ncbi:uncharacterized protein FFB20_14826 [Fusarium fujikuroi]|nr:uncharacterized protein FFC1_06793 [Fusarium fujikuroi]SCO15750.1 uncharacterized protein FFB20_14826 [Fusarium fujikuroi]SCO22868.1 uncharacterized protein FFE2_15474 [Fusarium fujikuroi]SCO37064.1 uncharacterized protein FFNC_05430 [Fusarium fujikuroi]SCV61445.1 uncharacterized protein FFFS_16015 [Fusarium fujikuroi]